MTATTAPKPKKPKKPAKRCRTVTKKVGGKKRRVKVCTTVKPAKKTVKPGAKPLFVLAPTAPSAVPPAPELPPSPALPVDPTPPDPIDPPAGGGGDGGGTGGGGDPQPTPMAISGPLSAQQAERLLWRAGFGPRSGDVAELAGTEAQDAVRSLTRYASPSYSGAQGTNGFLPFAPLDLWGHDHCDWLDRMVRCDTPLHERIALVWHDWFATQRGNVSARHMADQIQLFRDHGLGTFDNLLERVTKGPAMLVWLNGIQNRKNNPNENFAREVMELFTLGADRGAYTETDIREAAKALTGWRADWNTYLGDYDNFRYDAARHETGNKTIFGQTGDFDWQDVLRLCVEHPLHASYFCTRLWSYFAAGRPDDATLAYLTGVYGDSGRSIRAVVVAILLHPQCLDGPRLTVPPVVHAAGIVRAVGGRLTTDNWAWVGEMAGQRLFYPPSVAGWDETRWLDTSRERGRWYQAVYALEDHHVDPWPAGGSTYDPAETPEQAVTRALEFCGNPTITEGARTKLLAFATQAGALATSGWQKSPYYAMRQNALRMLILTSPDRTAC